MNPVVIVGSGMAGLGAVHRFAEHGLPTVVFDKNAYVGGHTASFRYEGGFTFDEGPHVSFTKVDRIQKLLAGNVADRYEILQTKVNNYWKGHWVKHPAQCNLYGLPTDLVVGCIADFVKAQQEDRQEIRTYGDWLLASFGATFAETFPMEYTLKYHTTTADNMSTDWLGPRLYRPTVEEVLAGALAPTTPDVHYIDHFRYPTDGGFVSYLQPFAAQTDLRLGHKAVALDPRARELRFDNGMSVHYGHLVCSMPLPEVVAIIDGPPPEVVQAADALACTTLVIVNVAVDRPELLDAHWTYIYDRDVFFTRLSTPHLQSANNVPPGCGSLQAECYWSKKYRPLDRPPESCVQPVLDDLQRIGVLRPEDRILFTNTMLVPYANVIFDLDRAAAVGVVRDYLHDVGVHTCGRYGEWGYLWTDESFMSGERAAQEVIDAQRP